jgi:predicted RNA methylase
MRTSKIDNDTLNALTGVVVTDGIARIETQLDRKLYLDVNKVLEALGGKWNRKARGHIFEGVEDVAERLEGVVALGAFVDPKKAYDFFETPADFALELAKTLNLKPGMRVLEPSAGRGRLIEAMKQVEPDLDVSCYEAMKANADYLTQKGYKVLGNDFLAANPGDADSYDAILMNPPFSKQQDIRHVEHALRFLNKRKSVLIAIMSAGVTFRSNATTVCFRRDIEHLDGVFTENPEGLFAPSGTNVRTVTLRVEY